MIQQFKETVNTPSNRNSGLQQPYLYTLDQEIGITTSHRGSKDLRAYWTWNAVEERKSQVTEVRE